MKSPEMVMSSFIGIESPPLTRPDARLTVIRFEVILLVESNGRGVDCDVDCERNLLQLVTKCNTL